MRRLLRDTPHTTHLFVRAYLPEWLAILVLYFILGLAGTSAVIAAVDIVTTLTLLPISYTSQSLLEQEFFWVQFGYIGTSLKISRAAILGLYSWEAICLLAGLFFCMEVCFEARAIPRRQQAWPLPIAFKLISQFIGSGLGAYFRWRQWQQPTLLASLTSNTAYCLIPGGLSCYMIVTKHNLVYQGVRDCVQNQVVVKLPICPHCDPQRANQQAMLTFLYSAYHAPASSNTAISRHFKQHELLDRNVNREIYQQLCGPNVRLPIGLDNTPRI